MSIPLALRGLIVGLALSAISRQPHSKFANAAVQSSPPGARGIYYSVRRLLD